MVEMHLLEVNADYRYDPIYALGVVTAFDRFMQGYRPEQDKPSIFDGLCKALQDDPGRYRHDAERWQQFASQPSLSIEGLQEWFERAVTAEPPDEMQQGVRAIADNPKFKYSRLFAIGLYSLLELTDPEFVKNEAQCNTALSRLCGVLKISDEKVQKDLELYRSNLDKMTQARVVLDDILKADKKKREEREKAKGLQNGTDTTPKNEAASGS